ncbi:MAG: hypothetical protein K2P85_02885 [Flavobacteriaceae bacterium]|nr:hypothetical protein [Flavobacteriaceae bacterium]
METTDAELELLEKKYKIFQRKLLSGNQMNLKEYEAEYLMKGGKNGQIDHQFPVQIDHRFRCKLTT